jgi:murein L,D-transpeptidase YcbB/YkuD
MTIRIRHVLWTVCVLLALAARSADASAQDGLWVHNGAATPQALALTRVLCSAETYGLRSVDYLDCAHFGPDAPDFNQTLTLAAKHFLQHVHFGRVEPRQAGFDLGFVRAPPHYDQILLQLSTASDIEQVIDEVEPPFEHYDLLKRALAHYRSLAAGQVQPTQAELLNAPYDKRISQIELTLERWRWLPVFRTPPIIVNIPQFRLFAFHSTRDLKEHILQMDVIVGRTFPKTRTPVFAADMKYVVIRPYWDVPYSITQKEMLPKLRSKPDYWQKQRLELVDGQGDSAPVVPFSPASLEQLAEGTLRLRQLPGPDNALGLIKFMLPNRYSVYLHSTPAHHLFKETRRTFSHGCIRVKDPVALADYVLRNATQQWTPESITAAMHGSKTVRVNLKTPIHVLILYGTALATEDGGILFFDDIYGHDRRLAQLLEQTSSRAGR